MDVVFKFFNYFKTVDNSCEVFFKKNKLSVPLKIPAPTPSLKSAIKFGNLYQVEKFFLTNTYNYPEWTEDGGFSLLCSAIKHDRFVIAELLLKKAAKVNHWDPTCPSITPLELAILKNNKFIVEMLLEKGAEVNPKFRGSLIDLAYWGLFNWDKLVSINKHLIQVNRKRSASRKQIQDLLERDRVYRKEHRFCHEIFCLLLKYGANINAEIPDDNILVSAAIKGDLKYVHLILQHNPDFNIKFRNGEEFFEYLLRRYRRRSQKSPEFLLNMYKVICLFIKYLIRTECMDFKLSERNFIAINNCVDFAVFRKKCEEEIETMKTDVIENTSVRIFDVFVKNIYWLYRYANNSDIVEVINSDNLKNKYPIYEEIIVERFELGLERRRLIDDFYVILIRNFNFLKTFNADSLDCLFKYLSCDDLKDFLRA